MEAVVAISSIAGIISLTIQGLQLIERLRTFCADLDATETGLFVKDLTASARILVDVKELCQQIQDAQNLAPMGGFRLASLQLQVEECTTDLEGWLALSRRFDGAGLREQEKSKRWKWARMYMEVLTKNTRGDLRKRFRFHQENMKIALSMLGREMDLHNAHNINKVNENVHHLSQKLVEQRIDSESQRKETQSQWEELSSSSSSIRSLLGTHDERLKEVQSAQRTSSKQLLKVVGLMENWSLDPASLHLPPSRLSSRRTIDASCTSEEVSKCAALDLGSPESGRRHDPLNSQHDSVETEAGKSRRRQSLTAASEVPSDCRCSYCIGSTPVDAATILSSTTAAFIDIVQTCFHPLLAEYIIGKHALHSLQFQNVLESLKALTSELEPVGTQAVLSSGLVEAQWQQHLQHDRVSVARRLRTLQKLCQGDNLEETVQNIDRTLGGETHFEAQARVLGIPGQWRLDLRSLIYMDREERKRDRLTRIGQWMLEILNHFPDLKQVHRWFMEDSNKVETYRRVRYSNGIDLRDEFGGTFDDFLRISNSDWGISNEVWRKSVMKHWFLDSAALTAEDYAATSTGGEESELSVSFESEADDDDSDLFERPQKTDLDNAPPPEDLKREVRYPHDHRRSVHVRGDIDMVSDFALVKDSRSASSDLEAYRFEPHRDARGWIREYYHKPDTWARWRGTSKVSSSTGNATDYSDCLCLFLTLEREGLAEATAKLRSPLSDLQRLPVLPRQSLELPRRKRQQRPVGERYSILNLKRRNEWDFVD